MHAKARFSLFFGSLLAILLVACFLSASAPTASSASTEAAVLHKWGPVVWGDEFQYTGKPDPAKWRVYNGPGHAGKGQRSRDQVSVSRGALHMVGDDKGKTAGMQSRYITKYQRVETRMKMNPGWVAAYHPVLILWPTSQQYDGRCWEIDYAEGNKGPGSIGFYNHIACSGTVHTRARKAINLYEWHNYAVEWNAKGVTGYIDGVKWFEDRNPRNSMNVTAKQTIQLDWFPKDGSPKLTTMHVDWTRTYKAGP